MVFPVTVIKPSVVLSEAVPDVVVVAFKKGKGGGVVVGDAVVEPEVETLVGPVGVVVELVVMEVVPTVVKPGPGDGAMASWP